MLNNFKYTIDNLGLAPIDLTYKAKDSLGVTISRHPQ